MVMEKVNLVARATKKILEAIFKKKTTDSLFISIVNRGAVDSIDYTSFIGVGN